MAAPVRFCAAWLVSLAVVLTLIGAFNALIDPYAVFGTPRIVGLNAVKPEARTHTALSKTYQIERMHPRAVLIGASRTVDLGLNTDLPVWRDDFRPVFDFGVPGSSPLFQYRTLQQAAAVGPIKLAVVVLSFFDALEPAPAGAAPLSDNERRLLVNADGGINPARSRQRARDLFLSTLTLGALEDSIGTLVAQYQADAQDLTDLGSTTEGAFRRAAAAEGYAPLFQSKEEEYARKSRQYAAAPNTPADKQFWLDTIRRMIQFGDEHHIRLVFVIAPCHADLLEIIDRAGLWDDFERWKIALAGVIQQHTSTPAALWDFGTYDRYSTEEVPRPHGNSAMRWFWEPVHFKKALGDLVLQRILTGEPMDFGVQLTPDNVRQHLADIRSARQAYREKGGNWLLRVTEAFSRGSRRDGVPSLD